jgi:hypothetical protein
MGTHIVKTFSEYINEGLIWDKIRKWLINNIKPIKKKYINYSSAYANQRLIFNRPDANIRLLVAENGFVYMSGITKSGKDVFLMTDDAVMEDYEDLITGEAPIRIVSAKMEDFEYGGMIPYYIYRIYES